MSTATLRFVCAALLVPQAAWAQECTERVSRENLARCILAVSLDVAAEAEQIEAARGRAVAAAPLLPSNPVASFALGRRVGDTTVTNWYATLSQEIEVAGQRGARRKAAQADLEASTYRLDSVRRNVLGLAWTAFFEAVAARDAQTLVAELYEATAAVARIARAKADEGLVAPVDADVAEATSLRVMQELRAAERGVAASGALLSTLLAAPTTMLVIEGDLAPLPNALVLADAVDEVERRPDILALGADQRTFELRAGALERARIPNPTLSLMLQNDGFNERVTGLGVSLPLPIPGNVGRTSIGEIAEARALASFAEREKARLTRDARLDVLRHASAFRSYAAELSVFTPDRLERARRTLHVIADEVKSGRLAVRDAVLAQQTLVELLRGHLATRRALCISSVALVHAAGGSLEEVSP